MELNNVLRYRDLQNIACPLGLVLRRTGEGADVIGVDNEVITSCPTLASCQAYLGKALIIFSGKGEDKNEIN